MATLEERVTRLEAIEDNRQLDAALAAQAYGISLVQSDVSIVRANSALIDERVIALGAEVGEMRTEVNAKLDAILERLGRG